MKDLRFCDQFLNSKDARALSYNSTSACSEDVGSSTDLDIESPLHFPTLCSNLSCPIDIGYDKESYSHLFKPITNQQKENYIILNNKLISLVAVLDGLLDSVNIRDECSKQPKAIQLSVPSIRSFGRRRTEPPHSTINKN